MTRFLDRGCESAIVSTIQDAFDMSGYTPEEIIPGLVAAIHFYAGMSMTPSECLDEAADLLAADPEEAV